MRCGDRLTLLRHAANFQRMRIPLWLVVPLCVLFVGILWWARMRNYGGLPEVPTPVAETPPSQPPAVEPAPVEPAPPVAVPVPEPEPVVEVPQIPEIPVTNLGISPSLDEYVEHAPLGAPSMAQLATALEAAGQFQRALLAWERVLDSMSANDADRTTAIAAITRLRPTLPDWNTDPKTTLALVLHISTNTSHKQALTPILDSLPKLIGTASSSIVSVEVTPEFSKSTRSNPSVPAAVAVWFTRTEKDSLSTEVIAFTPAAGTTPEALRSQLLAAMFKCIAGELAKSAAPLVAPRLPGDSVSPSEHDFSRSITRAQWQAFAHALVKP